MNDKLSKVLSQMFGVPIECISDSDGPNTIESWDSMAHINLVLALEAEYGISISPGEAADMLTVGAIRETLSDKGL